MTAPDTMAQARAALRDVVPRLVTLVRNVPDANSIAIGTWTVGDVAAHLSHVLRSDTDAVAGRPVPEATVTTAGMAEVNAKMLAEDGERDPAVLADRIATLADEFDDVASRSRAATVDWLQGTRLPPSAVACHLLEESSPSSPHPRPRKQPTPESRSDSPTPPVRRFTFVLVKAREWLGRF